MLLSIVIPCYNSAKYLSTTLNMLLDQNLEECEIILVNDGSTDNTLSIMEEFKKKRSEIFTIINVNNNGVSAARNLGLTNSKGKYVYFFDSDDCLTDESLNHYKKVIHENPGCDIYAYGYESRKSGSKKVFKSYTYPIFKNRRENGNFWTLKFLSKDFCVHMCSAVYSREFLISNGLRFKEGLAIGEDILFIVSALMKAKEMFYSDRICYTYVIRSDSVMQGYKSYSFKQFKSHVVLRELLLPVAESKDNFYQNISFFLTFSWISNFRYYLRSKEKNTLISNGLLKSSSIRYKPILFSGGLGIRQKMIILISRFLPVNAIIRIFK